MDIAPSLSPNGARANPKFLNQRGKIRSSSQWEAQKARRASRFLLTSLAWRWPSSDGARRSCGSRRPDGRLASASPLSSVFTAAAG